MEDVFQEESKKSKNISFDESHIDFFRKRKINASKLMCWFMNNYSDYKEFRKQQEQNENKN